MSIMWLKDVCHVIIGSTLLVHDEPTSIIIDCQEASDSTGIFDVLICVGIT